MGQKNQKGTVSIENAAGRIRLRWRYQNKRYSVSLFSFSKPNLVEAKKVALQIERDVLCNTLDVTLVRYTKRQQPVPARVKSMVTLFEEWVTDYRQMNCELNSDYYQVRNMLRRWGDINEVTILGLFNKEGVGPKTYNGRLSILKGFTSWMKKSGLWKTDPLEDVSSRKRKKTDKPDRKPFTFEEIQSILEAIRTDKFSNRSSRYPHSHYYPFIYFIFQTGCRPAEAVGLRVENVDFTTNMLFIKEVLARTVKGTNAAARVRKETKTGIERKIPINSDLKAILTPVILNKSTDELVFTSFNGLPIDDRMFQRRVFKPVLAKLGLPQRVLYACRHTFGSRCLELGIPPSSVAFLMGNSPETLLRNYTHQIKIPEILPGLN